MVQLAQAPKQYQQGWTEFFKLKFFLTPDVLIPRPETELLVEEVLKKAKEILLKNPKHKGISIIDVGTGSGCIAISVAKNLKGAGIVAVDISEKALEIAKKNARFHHTDNVVIIQNDLLEKFTVAPDIIVANLPYIPTARLMLIDPLVSEFEPKIALDGGLDGFELYRKMFSQMVDKNFYPKYLIAEIDDSQGELALAEARKYFPKSKIEVKKDLAKIDRVLIVGFI